MSREVRRVPPDFDFPPGETWTGYLMPDDLRLPDCSTCKGDGYSPEARAIAQTFYPHMIGGWDAAALAWHDKLGQAEVDHLIDRGRLQVWRDGKWNSEPRTAAEVNAAQRRPGLDGHDAVNRMILVRFRCERLGIDEKCATCGGHGDVATPEQRDASENWRGTDPPTGDGWQLWQTVSEGGPVSPVFATPEELADWVISEGDELDGAGTPRDDLLRWIVGDGQSMGTFVEVGGRVVSGVEFAATGGAS